MSKKIVTVCKCDNCGVPVNVPIKLLGQITARERKIKPTNEHMRKISLLGVEARKRNKIK